MGSVPCSRSVLDRRRRSGRVEDTDGFVVTRLSRALLRNDNAALLHSCGDIGQSHLRALARVTEMAFPAAGLRVLLFVHSGAGDFVSNHRKGKGPARARLSFLWTRLRHRLLEHGTSSHHYRGALGSAFSPAQIFHSDFRVLHRWISYRLCAGDLVDTYSLSSELAFTVFRET